MTNLRSAAVLIWIALAGPVQDAARALRRYYRMRHLRS